jgi:hypothetical protein
MGWRARAAGVVAIAGGLGVTALYLKNWNLTSVGPEQTTPYAETVGFKLDSGQPVTVRVARCDLGRTSRQYIVKVHAEVVNVGSFEIPSRLYSFPLLDAQGNLHPDHAAEDMPKSNTFALRPNERREFSTKYLLDPGAVQSSLDLAMVQGTQTNRLLRLKSAEALDLNMTEGQWRTFRAARWRS